MVRELYGITQDLKTKNYMVVLNFKCKICNKICNALHFHQNFGNWTSGNNDIDKFIQDTQLSVHSYKVSNALEWIPYDRFTNIKCIIITEKYRANWIDGNISYWNDYNKNWMRKNNNMIVELKTINNLKSIT